MTDKASFTDRFSDFYVRYEYAVILFLVLIWQSFFLSGADGRLMETDSYTHALRLLDFIQSGSWREILYRHDNCPYGQILHYTRFTDIFMYVMTLPFLPFMELKTAILYGSYLYNPVIACLSAVALIWAGRAFFPPLVRAFSLSIYFTSSVSDMFFAGRPDHHVLLNLLLIILSGCLLYGAKTQKTAYYKTAGIIAGLSVWATPEGFLTGIFLFAGMISAWLLRCQNMRQIRFFSQFFFISTAACLIVNPPMQGLFYPDNGRLSILMVVVLGLAFLSFYTEEILERKNFIRSFFKRSVSLLLLTGISLGIAVLIFGTKKLFSSPIPEELFDIWASFISELRPGYSENFAENKTTIPLDSCIVGIIAFFLADFRNKKILLTIGLPLIFFTGLTITIVRFIRVEVVFSLFILPLSIWIFLKNFSFPKERVSMGKKLAVVYLVFSFAVECANAYPRQRIWQNEGKELVEVVQFLPQSNGCIFAKNDAGPEIAWLTGRGVIGSPYHSNAQGIIDTFTIFNSKSLKSVIQILKKRQISTIILEAQSGQGNDRSFITRLYSGELNACFIRPVDLPLDLKEKYLVFTVDFTACDQQGK